jgi:anaerobic dimethyl sulfoxide reductase subunit B
MGVLLMQDEYGISFIEGKCVQCHACEVACKSWRDVELGVKWRSVKNIWLGNYPDIKLTSLSTGCMHCVEPACIDVCPEHAIKKRKEDGIVIVDPGLCTGCMLCKDACPFNVPQFGIDGKMQKCDLCLAKIDINSQNPPCVSSCPTGSIILLKMDRQKKIAEEIRMKELQTTVAMLTKSET